MSYSNDQVQIRAGLVNYIGALLKSSKMPTETAKKQNIAAILTEETLKLTQDEEGIFDLYALKPMLRGLVFVFKQRIDQLSNLPKTSEVSKNINNYNEIIKLLENIINMV